MPSLQFNQTEILSIFSSSRLFNPYATALNHLKIHKKLNFLMLFVPQPLALKTRYNCKMWSHVPFRIRLTYKYISTIIIETSWYSTFKPASFPALFVADSKALYPPAINLICHALGVVEICRDGDSQKIFFVSWRWKRDIHGSGHGPDLLFGNFFDMFQHHSWYLLGVVDFELAPLHHLNSNFLFRSKRNAVKAECFHIGLYFCWRKKETNDFVWKKGFLRSSYFSRH